MASIFLKTPVYITAQEVKDSTSKTGLIALSDDNIKILITKAQEMVDTYIISYGTKFDENQSLIFPVDVDGVSTIPEDIKIATFYCVEGIYENGDTIKPATTSGGEVIQEKTGDRTIQYSEGTTSDNKLTLLGVPLEAETILKKYRQTFIKNVI